VGGRRHVEFYLPLYQDLVRLAIGQVIKNNDVKNNGPSPE